MQEKDKWKSGKRKIRRGRRKMDSSGKGGRKEVAEKEQKRQNKDEKEGKGGIGTQAGKRKGRIERRNEKYETLNKRRRK